MNDNDFYAALGASIDGRGNVASGASMYGARDYANRQGSQRVREQIAAGGGGGASRASGPGLLDDAAEFAHEWTDNTVDFIASGFTWVPNWVGLAFRLIGVIAFLGCGIHFGITGLYLVGTAASGWLAPKVIKGTLKATLFLTLMSLCVCFFAALLVLMLGAVVGVLFLLAALFGS